MWPTLVANKILKKRLGSSNFIADYPISYAAEPLLGITSIDHSTLSSDETILDDHQEDVRKYKVFVSTWNVGGIAPEEDFNIKDLLETCYNFCDICVLGFQEIVPLKASNVLGSENRKVSMKWNSIIREALNKSSSTHQRDRDQNDFECIISKQMVGIFISVWARRHLRQFIKHPSVSCVGCGIMGCLGNKGSVSVRFRLHQTSFCFVCSHLASGGREGDEKYRNYNVSEIFSRTSFPGGGSLLHLPRKILDHDHVILLGDLNYRISLPEETIGLLVERRDWKTLLEHDQLMMELMSGNMLRGWHEGAIKFAPTYKYCPNSDLYWKETEKKRAPAWCDRIVWCGKGLKQLQYIRGESKLSDHRPVKAIFTADVRVLPAVRNMKSLFLSERFEHIKTSFEVSTTDEFTSCIKQSSFRV